MKLFYLPVFTALVSLSLPAQAATYVCGSGENTSYSSEKTDPSCRESQRAPAAKAEKTDKADIWADSFFDDLTVLPSAAQNTAANKAEPPKTTVSTKGQLEAALKQGGNAAHLQRAVADREANIRAIERELKKF